MAAKTNDKYVVMAKEIMEKVGGKENVTHCTHCATRLRFMVADKGKIDTDGLKKVNGVLGIVWQSEQLQIIIGQSVGSVYDAVCNTFSLGKNPVVDENLDEKQQEKKNGSPFKGLMGKIIACITPVIPILIAAGMLKVLSLLLVQVGICADDSPTVTVLNNCCSAGFMYLPIYVGAIAAKVFDASVPLSMMMGGILIIMSKTGGSIFGIPIYASTYTSSIFPIIFIVMIMGYVERFLTKHIPEMVRVLAVPALTMLITVPIGLCAVGPIADVLGVGITNGLNWLYELNAPITMAIYCGTTPIVVLTGLHHARGILNAQQLTDMGYSTFLTTGFIKNTAIGAACIAVALRAKNNKKLKSLCWSCAFTQYVGGISEPALFGVLVKYRRALYGSMIGSAVGGFLAGILDLKIFTMPGNTGLFGIPLFIGEDPMNLPYAILCMVVSAIVGLIATYVLFIDNRELEEN